MIISLCIGKMKNLVNDVNIGDNFPSIINCIVEVEKDTGSVKVQKYLAFVCLFFNILCHHKSQTIKPIKYTCLL